MFADVALNDLYSLLQRSSMDWLIVKLLLKGSMAAACTNLVNFSPIISEFTLLKRAVFAAIPTQFDGDLHSSHWLSDSYWKIAILISEE